MPIVDIVDILLTSIFSGTVGRVPVAVVDDKGTESGEMLLKYLHTFSISELSSGLPDNLLFARVSHLRALLWSSLNP